MSSRFKNNVKWFIIMIQLLMYYVVFNKIIALKIEAWEITSVIFVISIQTFYVITILLKEDY